MVKIWKSFSVFAVLALIFLLAPAVVLLPVDNVALGQVCNNTKQIETSFNFSETSNGGWHDFDAGSAAAGIDPEGLYLAQFTRDGVNRSTMLPDCQFRNYTTGSGTVAGTGLNGAMDVMWITWKFAQTYPGSPKYYQGSRFGTMMGRGHIDEGGGDNFTFVFILDYDSNNDMSAAGGKGFLVSVEENGRFGPMTLPPEQRHKVIGDFTITKTGTTYTGNFHLRNYDPSEVFDLGLLVITGAVKQEKSDAIRVGLDILNFTKDGPHPTPVTNQTTKFEEIAWGKDPAKNVISGHLGVGGEVDVARNTALYLELKPLVDPSGEVRIMGTAANNLYINDTDTGVRAGDGSKYGELWEILLLFIPDQELPVGQLFWQDGFTITPFYMPNPPTGLYVGSENFALASISIASSLVDAAQNSVNHIYGLYPHPKCEGTTPACGYPGQNLNVTIHGKYFLKADDYAPNTGSVDFGPGITVTSYTINSNDPVSNTITASLSIAGGATPGLRDVNVTSCFNYTSGSGTAPYLSGHCNFTVAVNNTTLEGHVSYLSRGTDNARWAQPFVVRCFEPGNLNNEIWRQTVTTNNTGVFTITGLPPCTYDIGIKNFTCLSELNTSVTLNNNSTNVVDFGTTREGDSNGNDADTGMDFSLLSAVFNTAPAGNPNCDFNRDGAVTGMDFSLLTGNFGQSGDLLGY